jgi:hypothetical protein
MPREKLYPLCLTSERPLRSFAGYRVVPSVLDKMVIVTVRVMDSTSAHRHLWLPFIEVIALKSQVCLPSAWGTGKAQSQIRNAEIRTLRRGTEETRHGIDAHHGAL